jgi:hypothetical protein
MKVISSVNETEGFNTKFDQLYDKKLFTDSEIDSIDDSIGTVNNENQSIIEEGMAH